MDGPFLECFVPLCLELPPIVPWRDLRCTLQQFKAQTRRNTLGLLQPVLLEPRVVPLSRPSHGLWWVLQPG